MAISSGERGTAGQQQDRANQRDRDRSVAGGGSGARGTRSQMQDRRNMANALRGGNRAPGVGRGGHSTMSDTAATHDIFSGKISAPSIPAGGVAQGNYPTQDDAGLDFSKAVGKHATRGFFDKAMDFLSGGFYDPKEPMAGNPRSFAGGDFHSTTNPGSVAGALAGMFGGGVGSLLGKVAGPAYTASGLPEIWHGGYDQPDLRAGPLGNTSAPIGASMADISASRRTSPFSGGQRAPLTGGGTGANDWRRRAVARALRSGVAA